MSPTSPNLFAELVLTHLDPEPRRKTSSGYSFLEVVKEIACADGFRMSVQASRTHYCTPRDDEGPWETVEVGFHSSRDARLMPYAENRKDPTGTVYAGVPIEVVAAVIAAHGGMVAT